jgi:hypothetical protein
MESLLAGGDNRGLHHNLAVQAGLGLRLGALRLAGEEATCDFAQPLCW